MKKTNKERLAVIEEKISTIEKAILNIKDNHLKHIYEQLLSLSKRAPGWATILIAFFSSLATALIVYGVVK